MATVKVKFRSSSVDSREGAIYYQVIHNRVARQVVTGYKIYAWEWDEKNRRIDMSNSSDRINLLLSINEKIRCDMARFSRVISSLMRKNMCFGAEDVVTEFSSLSSRLSLFNFMKDIIARLKCDGRTRTSETYRSALNSISRFSNNDDIMLDACGRDMIESYDAYLQSRGLVPNTRSFYLRILRAVYNRACEQGLLEISRNPFSHVFTGVDKTIKRAIGLDMIRRIKDLDLTSDRSADYARDMFMMSFYMRGMSFIDLAYLKKTDLTGGFVVYRRRKTGQRLTVKWTKQMQAILDKYPENETEHLLPIITSAMSNPRSQYRNRHYKVNCQLKTVAKLVGLRIPLTTYVARHSWASIARSKGISVSIISEGLGHDREQTTQIYLASLDSSAVDKANDIILSAL